MPDALVRGDVVSCRQAVGVVWAMEDGELTVLPIGRGDGMERRHKVRLDDLPAQNEAGIWGRDLIIHADMPTPVPPHGQKRIGRIPGRVMCLISQAMIRAHVEQQLAARWHGEREKRMDRLRGLRTAV